MSEGQTLSQLTAKLLVKLEDYFKQDKTDLVLAHGDTTTCFATAVSSFYHQIPFFHVEAGLRTHRLNSPFPEEFNRQTIAPIARHHFAPTGLERENLLRDGVSDAAITVTGSTVHEAVRTILSKPIPTSLPQSSILTDLRPLVVVTLHRREANASLENTLHGMRLAASHRPDVLFVCPVHPNPSVQNAFKKTLNGIENIILTEPLEYPQFLALLLKSQLVLTDSGGVQEEASYLGKKVLLARSETERTDGLHTGLVKLIGLDSHFIQRSLIEELSTVMKKTERPFSPSNASEIISEQVLRVVG